MNVLIPKQEIELAVANLSQKILTEDIFMIGIKQGAIPFMDMLFSYLWDQVSDKNTIVAKSYQGIVSTGDVYVYPDFSLNIIKNKNVLLLDDIFDTGQTLSRVKYILQCYEPKKLEIAVLLNKDKKRMCVDAIPDYSAITIPDKFVIGFGLDLDGKFRDLPDIYEITGEKVVD